MNKTHEWVGGIGSLPGWITGESGADYRPDVLLWIDVASGDVLGSTIDCRENILAIAPAQLQAAILRPLIGQPNAPARLRVASEPLAEVLRASHPDIDIVLAPTPELDQVMKAMTQHMAGSKDAPWWQTDAQDDAIGSFFGAAADLYESAPWTRIPDERCLLYVTVPAFGTQTFVISVIGQRGESFGFIVFDDLQSYRQYSEMAEAETSGDLPSVPRHAALSFDRGADASRSVRRAIIEHGWRVADENAYPSILQVEPDLTTRPLRDSDIALFEALARALTQALEPAAPWHSAWDGGDTVEMRLSVTTSQGPFEVFVGSEPSQLFALFEGHDSDLLAAFESLDLSEGLDSVDLEQLALLERSLLARLADSAEAVELDHPLMGIKLLLDHASSWFALPVTRLSADEVDEILFKIIPREGSIPASEARSIIESIHMAIRWMAQRHTIEHADACLALLGDDAVDRLQRELADSSNFGPAKSMIMAGIDAGFDMHSRAGIEAFMRTTGGRMPGFDPLGFDQPYDSYSSTPPADPALVRKQKQKRKAGRKAARKSRKKNR